MQTPTRILAAGALIALLGAGCSPAASQYTETGENGGDDGAYTTPNNTDETDEAASTYTVENAAFTLTLPDGVTYDSNEATTGRVQNYPRDREQMVLSTGEYFIEYFINTENDLEFNADYVNTANITVAGDTLSVGDAGAKGGDTTKYVKGYYRSGNGAESTSVLFRVYADDEAGLDAGLNLLNTITWKN